MAELLPCPFCGGEAHIEQYMQPKEEWRIMCTGCPTRFGRCAGLNKKEVIKAWNTRTPKEKGANKPKVTCLNCKHLMFSDMYGECNKQLRIVNPNDTCEFAEMDGGDFV